MNILRGSVIGLAGVIGGGVLAWPAVTNADSPDQDLLYKRDERSVDLVLADDEDDDPTNDRTRDRFTRGDNTVGARGDVDNTVGTRGDVTNDATRGDVTNNVTNNSTRGEVTNGTREDVSDNATRGDVTNDDATNDSTRDATG